MSEVEKLAKLIRQLVEVIITMIGILTSCIIIGLTVSWLFS